MRVTEQEVIAIMDTALTAAEVNPFLTDASELVDDVLFDAGMTVNRMASIEKWLAAHFVAIREPLAIERKIGSAVERYAALSTSAAAGLNATRYGQQVIMLDISGRLASLGTRKLIATGKSVRWQDHDG